MAVRIDSFYSLCCVFFGGAAGFLIGLPLTVGSDGTIVFNRMPLLLASAILGCVLGYRRRDSRFFFYVALIATLLLLSTVSYSLLPNP